MGIFNFFRPGKIRQKWTFTAKGAIWRILFSENGMIVGEDRNEEEKSISFFCLNELTGKVLWHGEKFGREWWSGIEAIDGNTFFIHGYGSPDIPEHKGVIAVDVFSGRILWENTDLQLLSARDGTIVASFGNLEKRVFCRIDPGTGVVLEETTNRTVVGNLPDLEVDERRYVFPVTLIPGEDKNSKIIREHIRPEELVGSIEYIEHDDMLLFNYYEKNVKSTQSQVVLNNYFKIVSIADEGLVFSEVLNTNVSYPVPDAFFFHDEELFYIKDRSILTAIQL